MTVAELSHPTRPLRLAVLISGNGSNLQALIDGCSSGELPCEIALVISNKADAYGLERAKKADIPTIVIDHTEFSDRTSFDQALHQAIQQANCELVCLAGFMRLLTPEFVNKWDQRMINIHPSLLPDFKGAHAIQDAFEAGAKQTGCTVHYVIPEMDAGPIILQKSVDILPDDTIDSLAQRIHTQEHIAYVEAVKTVSHVLLAEKNA